MEWLPELHLGSLELLDEQLGLMYCANDEEIYSDTLKLFCEMQQENSRQIQKLYAEGDWKNYCVKIHSLKSTSLTLGARALSMLAKHLELASRRKYEGEPMEEGDDLLVHGQDRLLSLYAETAAEMRRYLERQ